MPSPHSQSTLPTTLAQRIQVLRETLGLSRDRLAQQAALPLQDIDDLESGILLFLSPAVRQKLARVLKVKGSVLKDVERDPDEIPMVVLSKAGREQLIEEMLHFPDAEYPCPSCSTNLIVRLFHRRDLEDNPLLEVKAHCPKCLFKL